MGVSVKVCTRLGSDQGPDAQLAGHVERRATLHAHSDRPGFFDSLIMQHSARSLPVIPIKFPMKYLAHSPRLFLRHVTQAAAKQLAHS
jgi:hypothetical protein